MERKTIGGFIAALRKANGMTQKDLAALLGVSDKTVSRWERDDGAPDLSLIPVIAEIFGVSCDELLRGERRPPSERGEAPEGERTSAKGQKQRQHLLRSALSRYQNLTCVAMGVSVVGAIAAMICDLVFLKAVLGFLVGAIFFVASAVCQAIFVNRALLGVEDGGLDVEALSGYKRKVTALAERAIGLTVLFLGFTFPLLLVDAGLGLGAGSMLLQGAVGAAAFLLIYAVVLYFLNGWLVKKGRFNLSDDEAAVWRHNHRLKRVCGLVLAGLLAVTFVGHQFATELWGPWSIMNGTTFDDYDSFIAYMEQDISGDFGYEADLESSIAAESGAPVYYDAYGNEISEEEALTRSLEDENGNVVCEYVKRNQSVVSVQYTAQDGTVLPITVFTYSDLQEAEQVVARRSVIFGIAYCVEALAVIVIYCRRREKLSG